jgi:signal transduction histidine kinase
LLYGGARGPLIAPALARGIVAVVAGGFCAVALVLVVNEGVGPRLTTLSVGYLAALFVVQLFYFSQPRANRRASATYAVLAVQACLVFLPLIQFGRPWVGMPALLAGTVLLVLPTMVAGAAFAGIVACIALVQQAMTDSPLDVAYATVGTVVAALEVYGLTRLAGLITDLHAARTELASTAVAHERLRFARDLHELLGLSLSAIVPKGELAHRLIAANPERAHQELTEILGISRRSLADVRTVAHGYRDLNLDEESRTAESVLAASRVEVRLERNLGELPAHVRTVLAEVLREGVSNVLHHSAAERCDIVMRRAGRRVSLEIVNDGVTGSWSGFGKGLHTLAERATEMGGRIVAGPEPAGRFRLRVSIPLTDGGIEERATKPDWRVSRRPTALLVRVLGVGVLCGIFAKSVLYLVAESAAVTLPAVALTALLAIQLWMFTRPSGRSPLGVGLLSLQAGLAYLPVAFGAPPVGAGFLAGSALLVLRPVLGASAFTVIVASTGVVQARLTGTVLDVVHVTAEVVIGGLVVYGLTWMARSVLELRGARIELAHIAVAEERLRFARDLHDLLGLSLSAVTLKSELASRVVGHCPEQARAELTEIIDIARLALADVRQVASGYRELSLDEELRTADSLLVAAGVDVRLDLAAGELPAQIGTLLATVLREGVTNVLRHSKAEVCSITLQRCDTGVCLEILNDGVTQTPLPLIAGSGIDNLSYRAAQLGGTLCAGLSQDGQFRLRAEVPI